MELAFQERIVLGIDGSRHMLAAIDLAAAEAARRHLPLHLYAELSRPAAEAIRRACTTWPGLTVTARSAGDLAGTLIAESRTARLVVTARRDSLHRVVAAHAQSPVLVVPPDPGPRPDGPVLVGVDLRGNDEDPLAFAFEEAALRQVPLVVTHVWAGVPGNDLSPVDPYRYDGRAARETVERLLSETVAGWADKYPDVVVQQQARHDPDPVRALLAAGSAAGLLVLGGNRHGSSSSLLLGQLTRTVLDKAECPVAVVRVEARAASQRLRWFP